MKIEVENPLLNVKHDSFQLNTYSKCEIYQCLHCSSTFNSCEEGLQLDDDTYCSIDCLIEDLTMNGILRNI